MFIYQIVAMSVSGVGDGLYKCEENDKHTVELNLNSRYQYDLIDF